MNNSGAVTEA